jgi:UDP-glucose 4-epimerase
MNYLTLRLANVYGPRQFKGGEAGVVSIFVDNAVAGKKSTVFGDGSKTRDFVYVGDVVEAIISGLGTDYVGWLNIGTGLETTILGITEAIGEALGVPMDKQHLEDKPGEQKRSCLDVKKANDILGWQPKVFLKEGIKKTIEWAKSANG